MTYQIEPQFLCLCEGWTEDESLAGTKIGGVDMEIGSVLERQVARMAQCTFLFDNIHPCPSRLRPDSQPFFIYFFLPLFSSDLVPVFDETPDSSTHEPSPQDVKLLFTAEEFD